MFWQPLLNPLISILLSILIILAVGYALFVSLKKLKGIARYLCASLRIITALLLIFILLNPYGINRKKDYSGYHFDILCDVSNSMRFIPSRDEHSSYQIMEEWYKQGSYPEFIKGLPDNISVHKWAFARNIFPWEDRGMVNADNLNQSPIGDILKSHLLKDTKLAGILLCSDGILNQGVTLEEIANLARDRNIPVNVIGMEVEEKETDLSVRFTSIHKQLTVGNPEEITVLVKSSGKLSEEISGDILIKDNENNIVFRKKIDLNENGQEKIGFTYTPRIVGISLLTAELQLGKSDSNIENNTDIFVSDTKAPPQIDILYLGGELNLNYRFLKHYCIERDNVSLSACIRMNKDKIYRDGRYAPENLEITTEQLNLLSLIVIHGNILARLSEQTCESIRNFVQQKGGGVLVLGNMNNAELLKVKRKLVWLVPNSSFKTEEHVPIQIKMLPGTIFENNEIFDVFKLEPPYSIIKNHAIFQTPVIADLKEKNFLMAAHAYGAGKVLFFGGEQSWKWFMKSDLSHEQASYFWDSIINWLTDGSRQMLEILNVDSKSKQESFYNLMVTVRNQDFTLAFDAIVEVIIEDPSGKDKKIQLFPEQETAGYYTASCKFDEIGLYRINYRAVLPSGTLIEKSHVVKVDPINDELKDLKYREHNMRKLAKVTGGTYVKTGENREAVNLQLKKPDSWVETRYYYASNKLAIIFLIIVIGSEWIIRRQKGLR
ncbi:MAG: hypothetical protein ACUZ8O_10700 [Candidatus Anammoxibacter sp.]